MSSSGTTSLFGNFSSSMPTPGKSPKSPKTTLLENPLMKNAQFSFGGSQMSSVSTAMSTMPRSPLMALTPNVDRQKDDYKTRASQIATPGPPPKMSLSLMGSMAMPMQTEPSVEMRPQMQQQTEQRFSTKKTSTSVSAPVSLASPRVLEIKNKPENYFAETTSNFSSESLVADHWVVAHGYTNSNEYKELLGILSSYGTIQSQESGGNWLAVLYESRLSAEKALCCQPVILQNTLCGMTRGTPQLLQSLSSGKGEKDSQGLMQQKPAEASEGKQVDFAGKGNLNEHDILQLENSAYESREPYKPKSVCDKVFAWYFGWEDHPHSD